MGGSLDYFEVLDDQGHKTGQLLTRGAVHEQELWHETVNVWIINQNSEVLLQLRGPKIELNPGVWDVAIGTHVRPSEDPYDAAVRCLKTELGISITKEQLKHLFNMLAANPTEHGKMHRTLGHVFLLKRDIPLEDFTFDTNKVAQLSWRPLVDVMAEVGGTETAKNFYPRTGNYYPQLFDALQAEM
jgi:isopentenyldiphosphate isomerase